MRVARPIHRVRCRRSVVQTTGVLSDFTSAFRMIVPRHPVRGRYDRLGRLRATPALAEVVARV